MIDDATLKKWVGIINNRYPVNDDKGKKTSEKAVEEVSPGKYKLNSKFKYNIILDIENDPDLTPDEREDLCAILGVEDADIDRINNIQGELEATIEAMGGDNAWQNWLNSDKHKEEQKNKFGF